MSSISMSLLAILEEGPSFGFQLRNDFEERTGGVWALNVGQVYTTLDRLERDGSIELRPSRDGQKVYRITAAGRKRLAAWFKGKPAEKAPSRDDLVLKLVMASTRGPKEIAEVIQAQRRGAIELLQDYTRLKRDATSDADLGFSFLLDSMIFQAEARVRWLDACEARLAQRKRRPAARARAATRDVRPDEVKA